MYLLFAFIICFTYDIVETVRIERLCYFPKVVCKTITLQSRGCSPTVHDTATLQGFKAAKYLYLSLLAMNFRCLAVKIF